MSFHHICVILAVVGTSLAFTAEFIPKSYYVIHSNGERTPTVYLREKRTLQEPLFPLIRMRRSGGSEGGDGGGATSGSFSSSSSHASSGSGAGADAIYFGDNFAAGFHEAAKLAGFPNGFPGNAPGAGGFAFPGGAGGVGGAGCDGCGGYPSDAGHGIGLASRFGGGDDGVSYSGSAKGAKGVYSASSSSIDGDGNVKYSVKTGKY